MKAEGDASFRRFRRGSLDLPRATNVQLLKYFSNDRRVKMRIVSRLPGIPISETMVVYGDSTRCRIATQGFSLMSVLLDIVGRVVNVKPVQDLET